MMATEKVLALRTSLNVDSFLLYLIQQVTGESSVEILGFFNDFGRAVAQIGAEKRKSNTQTIRKDIRDFYPKSAIPFKLLIKGHYSSWRSVKEEYIDANGKVQWKWNNIQDPHYFASISVSFPEASQHFDSGVIDNMLLEKMLLGGDDLPPFKQPDPRTPKMFKALIEQVLKKGTQTESK